MVLQIVVVAKRNTIASSLRKKTGTVLCNDTGTGGRSGTVMEFFAHDFVSVASEPPGMPYKCISCTFLVKAPSDCS